MLLEYLPGHALNIPLIRNCLIEGPLSFPQLNATTQDGYDTLCKPEIQKWLEQHHEHTGQILCLTKWPAAAIRYPLVTDCLGNGSLSFAELNKTTEFGLIALSKVGVMNWLQEKKWLRGEQNHQYIGQILGVPNQLTVDALQFDMIRDFITNKALDFTQLNKITKGGFEAIVLREVRAWLEEKTLFGAENHQYIGQILRLASWKTNVDDPVIRDGIERKRYIFLEQDGFVAIVKAPE